MKNIKFLFFLSLTILFVGCSNPTRLYNNIKSQYPQDEIVWVPGTDIYLVRSKKNGAIYRIIPVGPPADVDSVINSQELFGPNK